MKITFLGPHIKISGGVRAMLTYAHLLSKRGHQVRFLVVSKKFIKRKIANFVKRQPAWFKDFGAELKRVPSFDEKYIPNGDIIVATAWHTARPVASFSSDKGKKFYLIQHYESLYHGDPKLVDPTYKLPLRKIVISHWLQNIMKEKFRSRSELLVTPVDFNLFYYIKNLRKNNVVRILMLDHEKKWKGIKEGFRAFEKVKEKFPNIELILFGVRRKVPEVKYDEYFYNPKQEKLAEIYSSCDIYLCPSEYEGLGMPPMEAMACKCALVTFDTGGSRDYAFDGKTALVAKRRDVNDLANKLELLVKDENLRKNIAENGYRFIRKMPSWEEQVEKLENIFEKSLNKNA